MAKIIDVSKKEITRREALAFCKVKLGRKLIELITNDKIPKGNVLETARLAGIMAAKNTPDILPLCHQLNIESVNIDVKLKKSEIEITAKVIANAKTGVEMEALTACSAAALTVYDMCKMFEKGIEITDIKLLKKSGGKTGDYERQK